jgi:hypothetical protein
MALQVPLFEQISAQVALLSIEERLRLIQQLVDGIETTLSSPSGRKLQYGQFRGQNMSSEHDFRMAEWHPNLSEYDS